MPFSISAHDDIQSDSAGFLSFEISTRRVFVRLHLYPLATPSAFGTPNTPTTKCIKLEKSPLGLYVPYKFCTNVVICSERKVLKNFAKIYFKVALRLQLRTSMEEMILEGNNEIMWSTVNFNNYVFLFSLNSQMARKVQKWTRRMCRKRKN